MRFLTSDPEIRANIYKSVLLNTLSLVSIYTFELIVEPFVRDQERWLHRNVGWFYHVMWLLPVVGTSFYLNVRPTLAYSILHAVLTSGKSNSLNEIFNKQSTWVTIIAKRTFVLQHGGRATVHQPAGYTGMLKAIATSAYRVVMVFTSLLVSFGLGIIPYAGPAASFVFFCWLDSYYCFE
ncbi:hypothetical protein MD484_g3198, partial [Candolleomyces efflorescens]